MTTTTYKMGTCHYCGRWTLSCPLGTEQTGESHLCERCTLSLTDDCGRRIATTSRTTGRVVLIDPDREHHDRDDAVDNSPDAVAARRAMFTGFGWGTS